VIALIDYKAGNLTSVKKALAAIGADVFVPETADALAGAAGIIVPGVGHFAATRALGRPWIDAILERVGEGRPLFGICLGMQWLFEGSDEAPELPGLGLLSGRCYRLAASPPTAIHNSQPVKVPHVGWNSMTIQREGGLLDGVPTGSQVVPTCGRVCPSARTIFRGCAHPSHCRAEVEGLLLTERPLSAT